MNQAYIVKDKESIYSAITKLSVNADVIITTGENILRAIDLLVLCDNSKSIQLVNYTNNKQFTTRNNRKLSICIQDMIQSAVRDSNFSTITSYFNSSCKVTKQIFADIRFSEVRHCTHIYFKYSRSCIEMLGTFEDGFSVITLPELVEIDVNIDYSRNLINDIKKYLKKALITNCRIDEVKRKCLYELYKPYVRSSKHLSESSAIDYRFQYIGALSLIGILSKYNIAYLADSVGLGKTITSLRVLAITGYKALVICNNSTVAEQWERSSIDVLQSSSYVRCITNTYKSMQNFIKDGNFEYDIVIFDEAHNFRNRNTLRYRYALDICCGKPVLLVGATPINNGITDLANQLMLGMDFSCTYDFGVGELGAYIDKLIAITRSSRDNPTKYKQAQKECGDELRRTIISKLMVRRTRKDITNQFKDDIDTGEIKFPAIENPLNIEYKYPGFTLANTIDILFGYNQRYRLSFAIYNKKHYITGKAKVDSKDDAEAAEIESNILSLALDNDEGFISSGSTPGFIRVSLIKMLDSSLQAFLNSLYKIRDKIHTEIISLVPYEDRHFIQNIITGEVLQLEYRIELENDLQVIDYLINTWNQVNDIKLSVLTNSLMKFSSKKIVVFTEFIETSKYLETELKRLGYRVLRVDGKDRVYKSQAISDNFGISGAWRDEYDILVSTNILSEGVNLNRVSVVVNYDIAWNPVTVIQRIGRLNRIDSIVDTINIINFFPCDEADKAIDSEYNIIRKYSLLGYSIGLDVDCLGKNSKLDNFMYPEIDWEKEADVNNIGEAISCLSNLDDTQLLDIDNSTVICSAQSDKKDLDKSTLALFRNGAIVVACKYSNNREFKFIEYNSFIEYVDSIVSVDTKLSKTCTIDKLYKGWQDKWLSSSENGPNKDKLINIVQRLISMLDAEIRTYGRAGIWQLETMERLENLEYFANTIISEQLARIYIGEYTEKMANTADISVNSQCGNMLSIVNPRFTARPFNDRSDKWNLVCLIHFVAGNQDE